MRFGPYFPFRRDNRKPDGTWDAPDATRDNIKGTSVDHYDPVWPRWRQTPPSDVEGEFVSDEPFFDIDEIAQKAEFYPPGRALVDKNVDGHPASRQRVSDTDAGNLWRRRLLVGAAQEGEIYSESPEAGRQMVADGPAMQLAGAAPSRPGAAPRAAAAPQTDFNDGDVDLLARLIFAEASGQFRAPGAYLGVGNVVLNRLKARGFPKTLQGVILGRTPGGGPQFAGTQNGQWRAAANPGALRGEDATGIAQRGRSPMTCFTAANTTLMTRRSGQPISTPADRLLCRPTISSGAESTRVDSRKHTEPVARSTETETSSCF